MLVHLRWAWEFREGMPIPIIVPQAPANAAPPRIPGGSAMSDQEPPEREVAEAVAAYGTAAATLRAGLERIASDYPIQPCRVVEAEEDGVRVLRVEFYGAAPDNNRERREARCKGETQPPRPMRWQWLRAVPVEPEPGESEIAEQLAKYARGAAQARELFEDGGRNAPDCPPGYGDDYDLDDWFYDLRTDPC